MSERAECGKPIGNGTFCSRPRDHATEIHHSVDLPPHVSSRCLAGRHGDGCVVAYDECACECHQGEHPLPPLDEDGDPVRPSPSRGEEQG